MREHGTLTAWIPDRGFGFIAPDQGDLPDLFAHVSQFPPDAKPAVGQQLSFVSALSPKGLGRTFAQNIQIEPAGERQVGTVKLIKHNYGFIARDGLSDVFYRRRTCPEGDDLAIGDRVSFEIRLVRGKPVGFNIQRSEP